MEEKKGKKSNLQQGLLVDTGMTSRKAFFGVPPIAKNMRYTRLVRGCRLGVCRRGSKWHSLLSEAFGKQSIYVCVSVYVGGQSAFDEALKLDRQKTISANRNGSPGWAHGFTACCGRFLTLDSTIRARVIGEQCVKRSRIPL